MYHTAFDKMRPFKQASEPVIEIPLTLSSSLKAQYADIIISILKIIIACS
jgi:hypothetical protein